MKNLSNKKLKSFIFKSEPIQSHPYLIIEINDGLDYLTVWFDYQNQVFAIFEMKIDNFTIPTDKHLKIVKNYLNNYVKIL